MFDLHELPRDSAETPDPSQFFPDGGAARIQSSVELAVARLLPWRLELDFVTATGRKRRVVHYGRADRLPCGKLILRGGLQDISCSSSPEAAPPREAIAATSTLLASVEQQRGALIKGMRMKAAGELAGGLAHRINSPLLVIQGKAHLLVKRLKSQAPDPAALEQDLEKILVATERITKMVNSLRSFARSSDCDSLRSVSLRQILDDTLELWHERLYHAGVTLRMDSVPDISVECRDVHISQAIFNLLDNAYCAVHELPEERWIELRVAEHDERVSIEISDGGGGVPPEIVDKIMLPFFTTKDVGRHLGLGLSISLQIASEHGGSLQHLAGRPHTCFALVLPLRQARK
jgi:C4-dicarboxylate-specific signal transduction histidine kinase